MKNKNIIIGIIEIIIYTLFYRYMLDEYGFKAFLITFVIMLFTITICFIKFKKGEK